MNTDQARIREIGKKEVEYDRQVAVTGKASANMVLYFWMKGYNYAQKRLEKMEEAGKEATSLIAHLKDQHGFNEAEKEAQDKIMEVFQYEGQW